jgi:hypothetical protein
MHKTSVIFEEGDPKILAKIEKQSLIQAFVNRLLDRSGEQDILSSSPD